MAPIEIYVILFTVIVCIGVVFRNISIPVPLLLVMAGMILSFFPAFPQVTLEPRVILNVFLPLLIYEVSAYSSWRDVRKNWRPITLLSVGHVIFITVAVAMIAHSLIPGLTWPIAFILGAVISPPDDVAIIAIAEKIHLPRRILSILSGEGMLNDATALVLFKFSLAAFITSQFSTVSAISTFFIIVIGESLYGLALGYIIGELRLKLNDPILHIIISLLTPFIAYLPPERLGGSGILATVITGLIIGHFYSEHYSPSARLIGRAVWQTLGFALMSLLFLLVGLNFRTTLQHISSIPLEQLILYSTVITLTVIIGRFVWVYGSLYITHIVLIFLGKKDPYPPWQYPFVVAWAGMRGGISLAAALAVPTLLLVIDGTDARNLLIFLVFCVITATLILQGLALPWVLQKLGIIKAGQSERYQEHVVELKARLALIKAVLNWLKEYAILVQDDAKITDEVKFHIQRYKELKKRLHERIIMHTDENKHNEIIEAYEEIIVAAQIIKVERIALANLWREGKITHAVRNKLLQHLDLRSRHLE